MTLPDALEAVFAAAWPHPSPAPSGIGPILVAVCNAARAEVTAIAIDDAALVRKIARTAADGETAATLAGVRAGELALADAAARGDDAAITALERAHHVTIDAACRRFDGPSYNADDLRQVLRRKLFVASDRPPKIDDYNGRGSLAGWLRVVATRTFIDLGRGADRARELPSDDSVAGAIAEADLELDTIKRELRGAVIAAMLTAVDEMDAADRHLLRQNLVGGLSIDQLCATLGVHRATVARRIARLRDRLAARTRELLAIELGANTAELDEVFGLVLSKLDISMRTLLATRPVRP